MSNVEYNFFMSQIRHIEDIKENEKIKISLVYYEMIRGACILKVCKNRDLSDVCKKLMEARHPNLAVVYDYLYADNNTYIIEEFINGTTLREILEQKGIFSEKETIKIIIDICNGLEVLHNQQPPIVHNDIKTSNIMIREDGNVKLFDFDISRTYKTGSGKNTRLFGTEEYAAPEHFGYGQSEPRTDIYSLGVTMHEMLTGNQLTNEHKMTYKGKLKRIIRKCIEIDPQNRYVSAKHLKTTLEKHNKKKRCIFKVLLFVCAMLGTFGIISQFTEERNLQHEKVIDVFVEKQTMNEEEKVTEITESHKGVSDNNSDKDNSLGKEVVITEESVKEEVNLSQENAVAVLSDEEAIDKKMGTVYTVKDKLQTIMAINDGTFVILENIRSEYYLRTSEGKEKKLENIDGDKPCDLAYNGYTNTLYLLEDLGPWTNIYTVDNELNCLFVANCESNIVNMINISKAYCNFFSDGMMISRAFDDELVDCNTWTLIGEGPEVDAIIGDKIFSLEYDFDNYVFSAINEIDFQENVIKRYDISEKLDEGYVSEFTTYSNKDAIYFIGTKNEKEYVYQFDGVEWKNIACLNDYTYYSKTYLDNFAVSDNAIWIYDRNAKVIKEFKLN